MSGINDEYLKALGRVTVEFSSLEHLLDVSLAGLVDETRDVGEIVAAQLSFKRKTELVDSLARHRLGEGRLTSDLSKILKKAINVENKRNTLVHSTWVLSDTHDDLASRWKKGSKMGRGFKTDFERVRVEKIDAVADEMNKVIDELFVSIKAVLLFVWRKPD